MNEDNVNENEVLQNEVETGESVTEVVAVDYTELLEQILAEEQAQSETLVAMREEFQGVKENVWDINATTGLLFLLAVLTFCWSCMRQWRKNILKMGE